MSRRLAAALLLLAPLALPAIGGDDAPKLTYASRRGPRPQPVDLQGRWILTMPNGVQWDATFEKRCRCGNITLRCGAALLQGEYELTGDRLTMSHPTDERMISLVWRVRNRNALELIEHPVTSQFGSDYRGALLVRRLDEGRPIVGNDPHVRYAPIAASGSVRE